MNNWKKAKERFRDHEHSQTHREACLKHSALQQPSVHSLLNSQKQGDQNKHKQMLFTQLTSLKYLMRQGLAVRRHDEEEGNLSQLLKCRSQDKTDIGEWLKNGTYQSHDINNEIIQSMANQLLRGLLDEFRSAEWYSLIADETRDASGAEQLGISLRWVDSSYTVHEDFIGLIQVEQQTLLLWHTQSKIHFYA